MFDMLFPKVNAKAIVQEALIRSKFTPDITLLEQSQFQLVFVCDDLMKAGQRYQIIRENSAYVCRGFTQRPYQFYRRRVDGAGVVMRPNKVYKDRYDFSALKIKGEIHCVESVDGMVKLDNHYQNGVQYKRHRVHILYPFRQHGQVVNKTTDGKPLPYTLQGNKHFLLPERVEPIEAWMYFGLRSYWNDLLDGGFLFEPVRILEPKEDRSWLIKFYSYLNRP